LRNSRASEKVADQERGSAAYSNEKAAGSERKSGDFGRRTGPQRNLWKLRFPGM
jgi:hypothetical protein